MKWFNDLKIGSKLLISNLLLGVLIIAMAGFAMQRLSIIGNNVNTVNNVLKAVDNLLQADRDLYQAVVAERSMIFMKPGSEDFLQLVKDHKENIAQAAARAEKFYELMNDPTFDKPYTTYQEYRAKWEAITNQIRTEREADTRAGRRTAMDLSFGSGQAAFEEMRGKIDDMVASAEAMVESASTATESSVAEAQTYMMVLLAISLVVGGAISYLFPKLIVKPMKELTNRMRDLAGGGGDLTQKVSVENHDEVGEMGDAVNDFISGLRSLLGDIISLGTKFAEQADSLDKSATRNNEVAEGATDETTRLAASITEMSASVNEVARTASDAAQQAQKADDESQKGQSVVESTKQAISDLSNEVQESAAAIEKLKDDATGIDTVVNVIRGIAEQTNLLALNAAIEAARAGEQGRGFAVVADEVRALASRTQSSTEEIQEMIGVLQSSADNAFTNMQRGKHSAENAVELSMQARSSLEEITDAIGHMADMNTQIAAAAEEQSAVSNELSANANNLSMFSRDSCDLSENVNSAAEAMNRMASELRQKLANFKV